jgi:hypothetical protein
MSFSVFSRGYQKDVLECAREAIINRRDGVISGQTGSGKSHMISLVVTEARRHGLSTLVLAHLSEIVDQFKKRGQISCTPQLVASAMRQSLASRDPEALSDLALSRAVNEARLNLSKALGVPLKFFSKMLLIIDESHYAFAAKQTQGLYDLVLLAFKGDINNILCFTATPNRVDSPWPILIDVSAKARDYIAKPILTHEVASNFFAIPHLAQRFPTPALFFCSDVLGSALLNQVIKLYSGKQSCLLVGSFRSSFSGLVMSLKARLGRLLANAYERREFIGSCPESGIARDSFIHLADGQQIHKQSLVRDVVYFMMLRLLDNKRIQNLSKEERTNIYLRLIEETDLSVSFAQRELFFALGDHSMKKASNLKTESSTFVFGKSSDLSLFQEVDVFYSKDSRRRAFTNNSSPDFFRSLESSFANKDDNDIWDSCLLISNLADNRFVNFDSFDLAQRTRQLEMFFEYFSEISILNSTSGEFIGGKVPYGCSAIKLSMGFDYPALRSVIMADKVVGSSILYEQRAGRGARRLKNKTFYNLIEVTLRSDLVLAQDRILSDRIQEFRLSTENFVKSPSSVSPDLLSTENLYSGFFCDNMSAFINAIIKRLSHLGNVNRRIGTFTIPNKVTPFPIRNERIYWGAVFISPSLLVDLTSELERASVLYTERTTVNPVDLSIVESPLDSTPLGLSSNAGAQLTNSSTSNYGSPPAVCVVESASSLFPGERRVLENLLTNILKQQSLDIYALSDELEKLLSVYQEFLSDQTLEEPRDSRLFTYKVSGLIKR